MSFYVIVIQRKLIDKHLSKFVHLSALIQKYSISAYNDKLRISQLLQNLKVIDDEVSLRYLTIIRQHFMIDLRVIRIQDGRTSKLSCKISNR